MLQTISLLVENKPGALMRITGVLSARGWNIDSLTVARTLDAEQSRMTIVVDIDPVLRRQVMKQMNKLINVLQATDLTESLAVRREMALVRVRATEENRAGILRDAEIYGPGWWTPPRTASGWSAPARSRKSRSSSTR